MRRFLVCLALFSWADSSLAQGVCGNGKIEEGEQCDDGSANSEYGPCFKDCTRKIVAFCGDGIVQDDEECDDGDKNSNTAPSACRKTCRLPRCGDGVVDKIEKCDDGNRRDGDQCSSDCQQFFTTYIEPPPEPPASNGEPLDPNRAFQLALVQTLFLPPGLGLLYGPSAGHWYAGEKSRAIGMTIARSALALGIFGTERAIINGRIEPGPGAFLLGLESLTFSVLVGVDLLDASNAVRRTLTNQSQ